MGTLLDRYGAGRVLDVGSCDINGSYRPIVEARRYTYTGVDIEDGPNVDIVTNTDLDDVPMADTVISGQTLEHVERPWEWIRKLSERVKPGGCVILIAPWTWKIHRHPLDCWRILPDGMRALLNWADLETLDVGVDKFDTWGVGKHKQ